eukprot:m.334557 g.334557  ORF g.334557 m.334557 type:complete len:113 (+) comp19786_c0_seq5:159-497(+)
MKIMTGRVNLADFLFAREYRGRDSYAAQSLKSVPAAVIAGRLTSKDPRAEPRVKERVPFLIVAGLPKAQLITLVRTPEEFLAVSVLTGDLSRHKPATCFLLSPVSLFARPAS